MCRLPHITPELIVLQHAAKEELKYLRSAHHKCLAVDLTALVPAETKRTLLARIKCRLIGK